MEDGLVDADRVLPGHEVVNYLQHRPVERSGVVQSQNIALDPSSNAMHITESGTGFEPSVLFCAAGPHNGHVVNEWKGVAVLWVTGDVSEFLKERKRDENIT